MQSRHPHAESAFLWAIGSALAVLVGRKALSSACGAIQRSSRMIPGDAPAIRGSRGMIRGRRSMIREHRRAIPGDG